jgi:hypothetical protein
VPKDVQKLARAVMILACKDALAGQAGIGLEPWAALAGLKPEKSG